MEKQSFNENFENFRKNAAEKSICCEMVTGHVVKTPMTSEEGKKLCFILGTLLEDYLVMRKKGDEVRFGPVTLTLNESNLFQPDLVTCENRSLAKRYGSGNPLPKMVIEILSNGNEVYDCLDKAVAYRSSGVKEYWLIDLTCQFVYTYGFRGGFDYQRYSFDQNVRSQCYPGFECCISDIMWADGGNLKELALFYRFRKEIYPDAGSQLVSEAESPYYIYDEGQYTAEAFYEWLETRRNRIKYTSLVELLFGSIKASSLPAFRHQSIWGNLYFAVKSYLKSSEAPYQLCFSPIVVELKKIDLLDSVVAPDLFLIHKDEIIYDNIYRGVPEWVVEVASPATAAQDYIDKAQLYRYHGIGEYWIINDWKRQIMVLRYGEKLADDQTKIYDFDEAVPVSALPGLEIIMDEILKLP